MNLLKSLLLTILALKTVSTKRVKIIGSDESLQKLVIYKECAVDKSKTTTAQPPPPVRLRQVSCRQICSSLCCHFQPQSCQAGNFNKLVQNRPLYGALNTPPPPSGPQAPLQTSWRPWAPVEVPKNATQPKETRRMFKENAKAHIKTMIKSDDDIKKILKELVRVTIQKMKLNKELKHEERKTNPDVDVMETDNEEFAMFHDDEEFDEEPVD